MEEGRRNILLIKCPHCAKILKNGKWWVRPTGKDLRDIKDNYDDIRFIERKCNKCEDK
jgi:hypothetical protein